MYKCSCIVTMISKQDQKNWLKIEWARGSVMKDHEKLVVKMHYLIVV